MKQCSRCQKAKPLSEFWKDSGQKDGRAVWCRECSLEYRREWRKNNLEKARATDRKNKRDEVKRKGRQHFRDTYNEWYANNADHKRQYEAERRKKNKKKKWAQNKLNKAVQRGEIVRPSTCSQCGEQKRVDGHHPDYNKPYDVVWLCRSCHTKLTYAENGKG